MTYVIQWTVPYGGISEKWCDTLEEVKEWVKANSHRPDRSYYDLSIYEITREVDVYELMKEG